LSQPVPIGIIEQITKQLNKLIDVVKFDGSCSGQAHISNVEMMLIKVKAATMDSAAH